MSLLSHNQSSLSSKNLQNKKLFYGDSVTDQPNVLNFFAKRDQMAELACKLLANKPCSYYMVFDFFMRKANNDTGISWHSNETIAKSISKSVSTVKRATKFLNDIRLITKTKRSHPNRNQTNLYMINYELANIKLLCKEPKFTERSLCDPQSSIQRLSNNNNEVTLNNVSKKKIYLNPFREIEAEKYFPDGKAFDLLVKHVPSCGWDMIFPELRFGVKQEEIKIGRKLTQAQANYIACMLIPKTMELRLRYGDARYIPLERRLRHKQNRTNVINKEELARKLSIEALKGFSKEEMDYYNTLN